jgi:ATP-dependent RNA helicase HelY
MAGTDDGTGPRPETGPGEASGPDGDPVRSAFLDGLGFRPDGFQLDAFDVLDDGDHVVVAAPTGSGKTLVADYAVARTAAAGRRLFYTTPIKALSNQKYNDLVAEHGWGRIGLLTGDNAINPEAPVVVMTTEVLRNMLYAGNPLARLGVVVLDEVHYLQDAYRGPVWEEVIIHLPHHIQLVCLSATVSNASELTEWIQTVRGPTSLVVETMRPVDLKHLYLVGERSGDHLHLVRSARGKRPNPNGYRFDIDPRQLVTRGGGGNRGRRRPRRRWRTPTRIETVELLRQRDLLPVIHFIFSRAACDDAAGAILDSGLVLTTGAERQRIGEIIDARIASLDQHDLEILGYDRFRAGLDAGVAAHHAGLVPPFKEVVEACFVEGLVKVVFATETLALGINMPARTVVIEKLSKFTGDHHEMLTPAQYTQLTGRAGRRGIDTQGKAVVLWSPYVRFEQVADLALSRHFVLTSSFRPTYNMAANLVRRHDMERARQLLDLSFAQFRADAGVVRSEERVDKLRDRRRQIRNRIERDHGSLEELRAALAAGTAGDDADRQEIVFGLSRLRPGEIIDVDGPDVPSPLLVLAVSFRKGGRVKVRATGRDEQTHELGPRGLDGPPVVVGQVELPEPYLPTSVAFVHESARLLARARVSSKRRRSPGQRRSVRSASDVPPAARKALRRLERIEQQIAEAGSVATRRAETLGGQFDRVIHLLEDHGHLLRRSDQASDGGTTWELTASGLRLARVYHESDLLVVEALEDGLFDGLDRAEVAALASCLIFEDRRREARGEPWYPTDRLRRRYLRLQGLHLRLATDESDSRLPVTRQPDPGFMPVAHGWAAGGDLGDVLEDEQITGGDFVRTVKQLVDLLRQLGQLAPAPATARAARSAAEAVHRDVVSASSLPDGPAAGADGSDTVDHAPEGAGIDDTEGDRAATDGPGSNGADPAGPGSGGPGAGRPRSDPGVAPGHGDVVGSIDLGGLTDR